MTTPYRDSNRTCPACNAPLREFRARLVCDACEGMLAPIEDLAHAIEEITGVVPAFEYRGDKDGKRACPACRAPMRTFELRVLLDGMRAKPSPALDRCEAHGIWFDRDELAEVFEVCRAKHPGGSGAAPRGGLRAPDGRRGAGWSGDSRGPFWWGGGHGNY